MSDKIKTIRSYKFSRKISSIMDKEVSVVKSPLSHEEYDDEGILLMEESWTESGALSEKYIYENSNGHRSKQVVYLDDDEIGQTEYYTYNDQGILTETIIEYLDSSQDTITASYDSDMNLISIISIDDDGDQGQAEYWKYENKKAISHKKINDFGNLELEIAWTYNEQGQLIKISSLNAVENIRSTIAYDYDSNENVVLESTYNNKGNLISEQSYKYDKHQRILMEQHETAKETIVTLNKYDTNGNQIESAMKNLDTDEIIYEVFREYNDNNLIQLSRVIEYSGDDIVGGYEVEYEYEFY